MTAGQAVQGGGALMQGIAGFQAGKANARMARAEANAALRQGVAQDDEIRSTARRTAGEAIAAMGANGGQIGTGSALDAMRDIELESGLDRLRVKTQAKNTYAAKQAQSRLYQRQGGWQLLASATDAASAFMGGGGS
jgi:hypothetical protein